MMHEREKSDPQWELGSRRTRRMRPTMRCMASLTLRSRWSKGRGPRGKRTSKARTGHRVGSACHRRSTARLETTRANRRRPIPPIGPPSSSSARARRGRWNVWTRSGASVDRCSVLVCSTPNRHRHGGRRGTHPLCQKRSSGAAPSRSVWTRQARELRTRLERSPAVRQISFEAIRLARDRGSPGRQRSAAWHLRGEQLGLLDLVEKARVIDAAGPIDVDVELLERS